MRSAKNNIAHHNLSYLQILPTIIGLALSGSTCSTGVFAEISPTNSEGLPDGNSTDSGIDEGTLDHSQEDTSSSASATHTSTTSASDSSSSSSGMDTDSIPPTTVADNTGSDNSDTTESSDSGTSTTSNDSDSTGTTSDSEPEDLDLPIGILIPGAFEQSSSDFQQCYSFDATAEIEYTLSISADDGPQNRKIQVKIDAANGETLLTSTDIEIHKALVRSFISDMDSRARLCLSAPKTGATYKYRLRVDPDLDHDLDQDPMSFEPNNSTATSKTIESSEVLASTLVSDILDFRDCYRIHTKAEIQYSLSLAAEYSDGGKSLYIDFLHADESIIFETHRLTVGTALTKSFSTPDDSFATLCTKTRDFDGVYDYRFRIDEDWKHELSQDPQSFEPNNTLASAYFASSGIALRSALSEETIDFRDCYRFAVNEDVTQTLIVAVDPTNNSGNVELEVLADDGGKIVEPTTIETGSTSINTFQKQATNDHAIACLSTATHQKRFDYQIRTDPDWNHGLVQDDSTYEPNDSPVTAKELLLGEAVTSELSIEQMDTVDCYRIMALDSGNKYSLKLQLIKGGAAQQIRRELFSGVDGKHLLTPKNIESGEDINEAFTMDDDGHATICLHSDSPQELQKYSIEVSATAI